MDKSAIKNFSIWARNKLIADITYKAGLLGVTEEGIKDALSQSKQDAEFYDIGTKEPYAIHGEEIKQRKELVAAIKRKASQLDYKDAYRNVVEEVAYTWFNRLIAIRFMEVNDYMPAHIRVLSSDSKNKLEPDLVTTPFDTELEFTQTETDKIMQMKDENQIDALFRFLFIKQCNALNAYLPKLFEKTSDYTELLLNVSVTDQDGIVYHLTHDINEDDFNISNIGEDGKPTGQVEIIGWMYQYYNTEPKDEAFALLKKNVKITKEHIPAATQLFTPDWIVRYMVENSVGRLWLEGHEDNNLKNEWIYYLDEAEQEADVAEQLRAIREEYKSIKPEEIKIIDPCMGSGHILVYAFDVLMQIYESYGYSQRDAAKSIVENNIYGLDIDDRAFQLSYFAIMMKARSYNRRFLTLEIEPNLCTIQESNGLQYDEDMGGFLLSEEHRETLKYLFHTFVDAKEYGSILNVEKRDSDGFLGAWKLTAEASLGNVVMMLWYNECNQVVPLLVKQAKLLSSQYDVVMTNPPYMGSVKMGGKLSNWVKENYPDSKSDMFAIFIERCGRLAKHNGYQSMITMQSWMFLSSYEVLREQILRTTQVINLLHLGIKAFEEIGNDVVQTVAFVFRKCVNNDYLGTYFKLLSHDRAEKVSDYLNRNNMYFMKQNKMMEIPGMPLAFWVSDNVIRAFCEYQTLGDVAEPKQGIATADNERFLRLWFEVEWNKIGFGYKNNDEAKASGLKWFPYQKGGDYRKWYGNNSYVVLWENDGYEIKHFYDSKGKLRSRPQNTDYCFRTGLTWTWISTGYFGARLSDQGAVFDVSGSTLFSGQDLRKLLGLLCSNVADYLLKIINPTINFSNGVISKLPVILDVSDDIIQLVDECVGIARRNWNNYETSWEFENNPLCRLYGNNKKLEGVHEQWLESCADEFAKMKENEDKINEYFVDLYGFQNEVDKFVEEKNIKLFRPDKKQDIIDLISYAVGCMFGRYSLKSAKIAYAGGDWDNSIYGDEQPDRDNIILITDEEYFEDDIVGRFCQWIKNIFGETNYEENITYIAGLLEEKGASPKECIRNYFLNNFFKNHSSMYSITGSGRRPIYWLFDAGKQNGFKALIYMHRYNADTIGNLRVDYLHRMERIYESEINRMQDAIDNSSNAREVTAATKRKEKLQKQLKECQEYDEKIGHLALSRIDINLDDGVKVNYEKVQTANDGKKYQVLAKI